MQSEGVVKNGCIEQTEAPLSVEEHGSLDSFFPEVIQPSADLMSLDGTTARLDKSRSRIQIRSAEDALLFEYDARQSRCRVFIPEGDLDLVAAKGHIRLEARDGVSVQSEAAIKMESDTSVTLASGDSSNSLNPEAVELKAEQINAAAARGRVEVNEASVAIARLDAAYESVRQTVGLLETHARRLVEVTHESFRQAEDLSEQKAGRVRWLVDGAFSLLGGHARVRMDEDIDMDAEQIRLG